MALEWLTQGSAPPNVQSNSTAVGQIPQWLADYQSGIAGKAVGLAGQGYTPYTAPRIAGFTPDQTTAFQTIRDSQGNWQPELDASTNTLGNIMPNVDNRLGQGAAYGSAATTTAGQASDQANAAVAGPAQSWTSNWQQYMSPYTQSVVNEIGRLGNRNLMENIIPQVQDQFIGSGQFGSTRNADILGRSIRDAQADISGRQSQALESGFGTSANIFGNDANRTQQQQQMQATTALGAGTLGANTNLSAGNMANQAAQIGANAGLGVAQQQSALAQMRQALAQKDAAALAATGQQQQGLNQQNMDLAYKDFLDQRDWDKNNLTWLSGMAKNNIVPQSNTVSTSEPLPDATMGPSALQLIGAGADLAKGSGLFDRIAAGWS